MNGDGKNKPLSHAERGRLGGLKARNQSEAGKLGGKKSRGGGRPRKYATASERQRAYLERKKATENHHQE